MSGQTVNRRRNYFIDKKFQSRFIVKFCLLIIIASALTAISVYWFNRQTTTVAFDQLKVVVKTTSDFIMPMTLQTLLIVTVLAGAATIVVTLVTSHRIAGPIYRFKVELEKIKRGDLTSHIHLRTKDQLKDVAQEADEMRIVLKNALGAIKENLNAVNSSLDKIKGGIKEDENKNRLLYSVKQIGAELSRFKVE